MKKIRAENIFSNFFLNKKLEKNFKFYATNLEKSLSISVPDEISNYFSKHDYNDSNNNTKLAPESPQKIRRATRKKKISINVCGEPSDESDCPQTPPPSPTRTFFNSAYLTKSESKIFEHLSESEEHSEREKSASVESPARDEVKHATSSEKLSSSMNRINLILVSERHRDFMSKFKSVQRHVLINMAGLQLNINPETWIFFLDFLGTNNFFIILYRA